MQQNYIREITISDIVKIIWINLKFFLIFLIFLLLILFGVLYFIKDSTVKKYTVSSTIKVNNGASNNNDANLKINLFDNDNVNSVNNVNMASNSQIIANLLISPYILQNIIESDQLNIEYKQINNNLLTNLLNKKSAQKLDIVNFKVNSNQYNVGFIIKFISESSYSLYTENKHLLGVGHIGRESNFNGVTLLINSPEIIGSEFNIRKKSMDVVLNELTKMIQVEPVLVRGEFTQFDTGIINLSFTGTNPVKQAKLLNDIVLNIQQKALQQRQEALSKAIQFLTQQIETVKANLLDKQLQLVKFQDSKQVVNLNEQVVHDLNMLTDMNIKITEKQATIDQFKSLYAPSHPLMISLNKQKAALIENRDKYTKDLATMPAKDALYSNIKNNLDINKQIYVALVNKLQGLQLEYASAVSPVTILNFATGNVAPVVVALSAKLIASSIVGILVLEIILILLYVFMVGGDPFLFAKIAKIDLLTIIPFFSKVRQLGSSYLINHPSINKFAAYLLSIKIKDKPLIVNLGSIKKASGKSFIITVLMDYLCRMNKRSIHIQFGTTSDCMPLSVAYDYLYKLNITDDKNMVLKINITNMLNDELLNDLFSRIKGFDFIFVESPDFMSSGLFLNLARLISTIVMVTTPKDSEANITLLMNGLKGVGVTISHVIFNHPQKRLLNSVYSIVNSE